jgi:hypothetical protein
MLLASNLILADVGDSLVIGLMFAVLGAVGGFYYCRKSSK